RETFRRLLGPVFHKEMTGVKRPSTHTVCPVPPDRKGIAKPLDEAASFPQREHRTIDVTAVSAIGAIVFKVDGVARAVLVANRPKDLRIRKEAQVLLEDIRLD